MLTGTPTPYICTETPNRTGREVRAEIRRVNARALEALLVSPSVAKASSRCQILRMNSESLQSLHVYIRMDDRMITSKPVPEMR